MPENDGAGNGAGAPPPPPPANDELQKQLNTLLEQQKNWQAKEHQYIDAMNKLAERVPLEEDDRQKSPPDFDSETNEILERRVNERISPIQQQMQHQADMLDQMMFMQHAAAMGATPQQVGAAEDQYQQWQAADFRTVMRGKNGKSVERRPTRKEALAFQLGNGAMGNMLKEAPDRNMQALRQNLLGAAAFEAPGGGMRQVQRPGLNFDEVESKPLNERIKMREEFLDKTGF